MTTRVPAVAGLFYPGNENELRQEVSALLNEAKPRIQGARALVVPHAGYAYSGPIAASAYRAIEGMRGIRRVLLLGPAHRVYLRGMAIPDVDAFSSPMGEVPVDRRALDALQSLPFVMVSNEAHAAEHSLEVQLPFLQMLLGDFLLVPVVVGDVPAEHVAALIESLWAEDTLVVVSTDLSHYHDYVAARRIDAVTITEILEREAGLSSEQACGCHPLNGLLELLDQKGLQIDLVDARNSGDTAGAQDRVVGYAGFVVH